MEPDTERLTEYAGELVTAACRLADSVAVPSTAIHLPAVLARIGDALDALSLAFERAPHSLVPAGDPQEPVCRRFDRATDAWPATYGCEGPSYERQVQLLSSLYEAGATLRMSRRACARANDLLIDMTVSGDPAARMRHEASTVFG